MLITTVIYCYGLKRPHASSDAILKLFLGMFTKLQKATLDFIMSVSLHVTTLLPLNGFLINCIFEYFLFFC
jgi:hypothetical protein